MEEAGPVRKRRKGGLHQRAAAHQQAIDVDSALKELLMRYRTEASEGLMVNGLDEIATLTHGKNLHRSMMAKLAKDATLPEPFEVNIPLQSVPAGKASSKVLLPHEQFVHMYNSKEGWDASILPDPAGLHSFWEHFSKHPCVKNHPILSKENYEEKAIPLALHGDEVPVMGVGKIWCHSSLALSWNSLMATAAGRLVCSCFGRCSLRAPFLVMRYACFGPLSKPFALFFFQKPSFNTHSTGRFLQWTTRSPKAVASALLELGSAGGGLPSQAG